MQANLQDKWTYENGFMLTAGVERFGKMFNQWDLFRRIPEGDIVEVGVFKGASLARLLAFRKLMNHEGRVWGFDTFAEFPDSEYDQCFIDNFTAHAGHPLSASEISFYLDENGHDNYSLVQGDIHDTIPLWLHQRSPNIALLHIDVDAYEPTKFALSRLLPYMAKGGIIMFDDYAHCEGARRATNEILHSEPMPMPYYKAPYYLIIK